MFKNKQGIIRKIRQSRTFRGVSALLLFSLLFEIAQPTVSLALTEGPSQPEVQSFEPVGTTQMVDLFSGDFNYNIPLFNLPGPNGGYPVNLAYHAGATMDDEASWVGLGWNINVGSLVRSMRGLPDEFMSVKSTDDDQTANGAYDYLEVQNDAKESWTLGVTGGLHPELFGANLNAGDVAPSLSASIYYNNYNGIGLSLDPSVSIGNVNSAFTVGLSIDSENGLGVNASLSLYNGAKLERTAHTIGVSFDGSLSVDYTISRHEQKMYYKAATKDTPEKMVVTPSRTTAHYGVGMSFARNGFSPSVQGNMNSYNISLSLKTGISGFGIFAAGSVGLFFNTQDYSGADKAGRKRLVAGYAAAGKSTTNDRSYTRDYIRSYDGQITKASMFLPNTNYAYDVYNSTGQGLSGYFRTRRADIGRSFDPYIWNNTFGLSASLDLSAGTHIGFGIGLNYGYNTQGPWDDLNAIQYDFLNPDNTTNNLEEITYYQAHGEQTILHPDELDYMRGLDLPFVRLKPKSDDNLSGGKRRVDATTPSVPNNEYAQKRTPNERVVRNTLIHDLKNNEVGALGEFNIKYFSDESQVFGSPQNQLTRDFRNSVHIGNHPAGYKVLNQEGSYYVYGLPAYNNKEVDNLFSVEDPSDPSNVETIPTAGTFDYKAPGTNKFINKTTKSPYAHSYLLTSVQGADYIDLSNNGPTDDDMGYWVKFNYVRSSDNYKWRAPYRDNQYSQGQVWTAEDDKASYQYGEKEMWYLGQIETKSHIAVFVLEERADMKGAEKEYNGANQPVEKAMKLKEIRVYDKKTFQADPNAAVPLTKVVFEYETGTNQLCKGAPNADNGTGKLTLKSLYFASNGSTRGSLNKYTFDYTSTNTPNYDNPNYAMNSYDSWGNYKPKGSKFEHTSRFPYVNQFNQDWGDGWEPTYGTGEENATTKELTQKTQNALVSAWCLKKITLPSGSTINIEYESDDYGYVQHKTANQMFRITKMGDDPQLSSDEIYDSSFGNNDYANDNSFNDELRRRIYFKLEEPIPVATSEYNANMQVYKDYVLPIIKDEKGDRNLYFKSKIALSAGVYDYVSGYLPLEDVFNPGGADNYNFGVQDAPTNGYYRYGFVTVKPTKKKNGNYFDQYHPMALAAWTYLQTNAQMVLSNSNNANFQMGSNPSANDIINQLTAVMSVVPATASSFGGIRSYCRNHMLAKTVKLDYSCIRLASPDKKKFGGGHRVKKISITDNWAGDTGNAEQSRTYGQEYDYTMVEDGKVISSGVAQYEPQAGGDENALKYPIHYHDKQSLFTKNNLFAEAPVNEALFPGSSVGYRKVTAKSINTATQMKAASTGQATGRTGGVIVHEFYTAKEFPTMVSYSILSEENSTKDVFNLPIIIPLIGSIKRNYYHGTQAYMIELNDMHGKPKSVESFELNNYALNTNPITSTSYDYQFDVVSYQGETVKKLNSYVNVIANDGDHEVGTAQRLMGVETDLYTDQRESRTFGTSAGLDFNVDVPFIPWLSVWPTFSNNKTMFRTYVTNKVIHRSGILKRVKSRDLQTVNESEIIAYDEKSGIAILSKMKNEYGDDFYSYATPAYYTYDRMGHAYRNINFTFTTELQTGDPYGETVTPYLDFPADGLYDKLVRGDELLVMDAYNSSDNYKKVYFLGWKYTGNGTKGMLHSPFGNITVENGHTYKFKVIRSGRRNTFGGAVATYLTKGKFEDLIKDPNNPGNINYGLVDPNDNQIRTPKIAAESVLIAKSTVYRDDWSTSVQTDLSNDLITENPFLTGNSGIWRPAKTYTYVGQRKTSASMNDNTTSDPQLYNDGVFKDAVPMFTWDLGNMEDYVSNWEWVSEVTRYSPDAYQIENRNRLGIYSSALYGYDNSLSIGVTANAEYNESGVADFETIKGGGAIGDFIRLLSQTNLNFDNNHSSGQNIVTQQFTFKKAVTEGTNIRIQFANTNIPSNFLTGQSIRFVGLSMTTRKNAGILGNLGYYFNASIEKLTNGTDIVLHPFLRRDSGDKLVEDNGVYHGVITFFLNRTHKEIVTSNVSYVDQKAHSGKRSMRLEPDTDLTFDQTNLKLKAGKKYLLSLWVSRTDENTTTFKPSGSDVVMLGRMNGTAFSALPIAPVLKYGKIIEGWQKVDVEFTWNADNDIPAIRLLSGAQVMYADDIRLCPKSGGMTTSVYDPLRYLLKASLNVDNYATFFYYDEEGNLHLKKQETEKGIFTSVESRSHEGR